MCENTEYRQGVRGDGDRYDLQNKSLDKCLFWTWVFLSFLVQFLSSQKNRVVLVCVAVPGNLSVLNLFSKNSNRISRPRELMHICNNIFIKQLQQVLGSLVIKCFGVMADRITQVYVCYLWTAVVHLFPSQSIWESFTPIQTLKTFQQPVTSWPLLPEIACPPFPV